jgi:hypothetical protein
VFPADKLEEMVNVGTLFVFQLVSGGVIILRRTRPDTAARHPCAAGATAADRVGVRVRLADGQPHRRHLLGFTKMPSVSRQRTYSKVLSNPKEL